MRFYQLFLAALAFNLLGVAAPVIAATEDETELRQLTEENFRSSTAQGLWLVEHFSPKCSHCRAFAPTWEQLAREKHHLERLSGFHMAQVNCLAQGDLCNSNGIKFYPQLVLYSNGKALPPYSGDRSHPDLSNFIDEQSTLYARGQLGESREEQEVVSSGFGRPNSEGKILDVDENGLETLISNGPVLAEFFAPWCGHCKKLRPIYEQLAESLQGKLNVAAVNCDDNNAYCRKQGVQGYPTIKLFHHDTKVDFTGARSLSNLQKFAKKGIEQATVQVIKLEDLEEIITSDDAFFLYLQNFDTSVDDLENVKSILQPHLQNIPAYTSSDPLLYANLSIANPPPTSILLTFSSHSILPVGSLPFPADKDQVTRFVNLHRFPTLVQLKSSNYQAIMRSDAKAIVVLGAVHHGDEGAKERERLAEVARAWKRGGRGFSQPVWFVWVDGEKWAGWLRQSYGIRKRKLPEVVVIDPPSNEYYDTTIEGTPLSFDGNAIFSVLEGVYQHFLRPKRSETALEWGSRGPTMTLIHLSETAMDHPLFALVTVVGSVAVFVFLLQRCVSRDPREAREAVGARLD